MVNGKLIITRGNFNTRSETQPKIFGKKIISPMITAAIDKIRTAPAAQCLASLAPG